MQMLQFLAAPIVLSILLVGIHAYLGLHVIEREVIFVDISLSQVAALGGAIALWIGFEENSNMLIFCSLGLCLVTALALSLFRQWERKVSQEAIIGVTYALASGTLMLVMNNLPHGDEHIKSALIGNILVVDWPQVRETALIYSVVGLLHFIFRKQFWALSRNEKKSFVWDFFFYFLFGVVITFSTHHAGVLVVFSILVVPAALACRNFTSIVSRLIFAWSFGVAAVLGAFFLCAYFDWPGGAGIVVTVTSLFFITLGAFNIRDRLKAA